MAFIIGIRTSPYRISLFLSNCFHKIANGSPVFIWYWRRTFRVNPKCFHLALSFHIDWSTREYAHSGALLAQQSSRIFTTVDTIFLRVAFHTTRRVDCISKETVPRISGTNNIAYNRSWMKSNSNIDESHTWIVLVNQCLICNSNCINSKFSDSLAMIRLIFRQIRHCHVSITNAIVGKRRIVKFDESVSMIPFLK